MYFFYTDESGNTGADLRSTVQPIHWIVALCITPPAARQVEDAMSALALRYFRDRAREPDFEFHGSEIFSGRGDCRDLTPTQRVSLYGELVSLVAEHSCRLFVRGIHKQRHKRRADERGYVPEHPHTLGFRYLVERLDEWLEEHQPEQDIFEGAPPEYGLIVADEQAEVDREIVERFAFWRNHGTRQGYRAREIYYFIDTVHYVPSHDSWLIQLVDCVAYLRNRYARVLRESGYQDEGYSQSERAIVRLWQDYCQTQVEVDQVWPR